MLVRRSTNLNRPTVRDLPLCGGRLEAVQHPLDPGPATRALLLGLPVIRGHPPEEVLAGPFVVHPPDVVLLPPRPAALPLVVPEVQVPPRPERPHPRTAPDLHHHTSK